MGFCSEGCDVGFGEALTSRREVHAGWNGNNSASYKQYALLTNTPSPLDHFANAVDGVDPNDLVVVSSRGCVSLIEITVLGFIAISAV